MIKWCEEIDNEIEKGCKEIDDQMDQMLQQKKKSKIKLVKGCEETDN